MDAEEKALAAINSIPREIEGAAVFAAPWQAEVFAITLSLHEQGVFEWAEWAELLSGKIEDAQSQGDPDLGDTYYLHWLNALEQLVVLKQLGDAEQLSGLYQAWDAAARATPHGQPITLD